MREEEFEKKEVSCGEGNTLDELIISSLYEKSREKPRSVCVAKLEC